MQTPQTLSYNPPPPNKQKKKRQVSGGLVSPESPRRAKRPKASKHEFRFDVGTFGILSMDPKLEDLCNKRLVITISVGFVISSRNAGIYMVDPPPSASIEALHE